MTQIHTVAQPPIIVQSAGKQIPALTHAEAMEMSTEQLRRFLVLIDSLSGEDWNQSTACDLWTVKDIVAHQAAHVRSFISVGSFLSQLNPIRLFPYLKKGMGILDAWNQSEVDLRRTLSPSELIAEIREYAERSLQGKDRIPAILRSITLPAPGLDQPRSIGYVFDLIYTRDMWMHHIDICRATGHTLALDSRHDGRTVALIVRDLIEKSKQDLTERSAVLELGGIAGSSYHIGADVPPTTTLKIDAITFCILTSGREKAVNLLHSNQVAISGDSTFGQEVLQYCENRVLF